MKMLNVAADKFGQDEKSILKFKASIFIMFLAAISSPVVGFLHLYNISGYGSQLHAINCFVFSVAQFGLMFYLYNHPQKQGRVALVSSLLIFLIFTSNLFLSLNEEIRILWFVILLLVSDIMGGHKLRGYVEFALVALFVAYFSMPDIRAGHTFNNAFSSVLIVMLVGLIIRYYGMVSERFQSHLESEVKVRTKELWEEKERAERASMAKSEFLSSMSHELRTPMNAVLGFSQLMEHDENLNEEQKDNIREVINAGSHLLELINQVLDLAKIEAGRMELSIEPVSIKDVMRSCSKLVEKMAEKRGVTLIINNDCLDARQIRADYTRTKQVLLNLISNAIKYNRVGGKVNINCCVDSASLRISVADTGHGIPSEKFDKLFEAFERLGAEAGTIEGTGIGLVITKQLVSMMGGELGVESVVGEGSTFWVTLPLS